MHTIRAATHRDLCCRVDQHSAACLLRQRAQHLEQIDLRALVASWHIEQDRGWLERLKRSFEPGPKGRRIADQGTDKVDVEGHHTLCSLKPEGNHRACQP